MKLTFIRERRFRCKNPAALMVAESHDHGQSPQQNEAGNRHCYDAVGSVEKPAFSRRRLRLWGVAVLVAVAGAVCLMGLARERQGGAATDALLESNTAAPHGREAGQETRDRARVEALKAKRGNRKRVR